MSNFAADGPIQILGAAALVERQISAAKETDRHVERLLCVVITFQQVVGREVLVCVPELFERLLDLVLKLVRDGFLAKPGNAQDAKDQHAVIGDHGASAFGNDFRMGHLDFIAHALNVIDDVVGVFLERVICAGFAFGLGSVVVDAQPSADVQDFEWGAALDKLSIDLCGLDQCAFQVADVGHLAAQMEVQQLKAIFFTLFFELFEGLENFTDGQPEF